MRHQVPHQIGNFPFKFPTICEGLQLWGEPISTGLSPHSPSYFSKSIGNKRERRRRIYIEFSPPHVGNVGNVGNDNNRTTPKGATTVSSNTALRYRHSGEKIYPLIATRDSAPPTPSADNDSCDCSFCRERRAAARQRTRNTVKIKTPATLNELNRKTYGKE